MNLKEKEQKLKEIIGDCTSAIVAYSGGVDSTYLLKASFDVLGENVLAVTACSSTYPASERQQALDIADKIGTRHKFIIAEELDIPEFSDNPPDRCYYCKKELYTKLLHVAKEENIANVFDGSNADDINDYRPGSKAIQELGIKSPLKQAGLTKDDIRELSKKLDLPTWDKPVQACLSSRFPYGNKITKEKLTQVEKAEVFLKSLGLTQLRVRHHDSVARIETSPDEFNILLEKRIEVYNQLSDLGFTYVTLDLEGYNTGSLNRLLPDETKVI